MALVRRRCRLRYLLARAKMTQAELSRRTGYSPQQISNWVNDREHMNYESAATVAYVLSCHMEELYELEWI
ncbi:hypothetical protein J41TS12_17250 [Paenibacillus antibioticophila]|uniref:HTH cro/C1-type domain-containing protein n=1 Tax=Paenibacillus antibioticophila TaxID=1274374 RepID=A0A920CH73_9BACL|nr:helix-turn-helix transcriptional regulator [Paenibacillus antibioticophila]GIO36864.1 hypothetical protein J41TS12_17250 [Paenibacillus antibioticophila]